MDHTAIASRHDRRSLIVDGAKLVQLFLRLPSHGVLATLLRCHLLPVSLVAPERLRGDLAYLLAILGAAVRRGTNDHMSILPRGCDTTGASLPIVVRSHI